MERVIIEAQLLKEERWLVDALKKIKNQRNALQIERLHLESLLSRNAVNSIEKKKSEKLAKEIDNQKQLLEALADDLNKEQTTEPDAWVNMPSTSTASYPSYPLDGDEFCNQQALDLNVNDFTFGMDKNYTDMEVEEEDDDDFEEGRFDMNFFMNGPQ